MVLELIMLILDSGYIPTILLGIYSLILEFFFSYFFNNLGNVMILE